MRYSLWPRTRRWSLSEPKSFGVSIILSSRLSFPCSDIEKERALPVTNMIRPRYSFTSVKEKIVAADKRFQCFQKQPPWPPPFLIGISNAEKLQSDYFWGSSRNLFSIFNLQHVPYIYLIKRLWKRKLLLKLLQAKTKCYDLLPILTPTSSLLSLLEHTSVVPTIQCSLSSNLPVTLLNLKFPEGSTKLAPRDTFTDSINSTTHNSAC